MLKASQVRTKRAAFSDVDVEAAGELGRLVGDDADGKAVDAAEADDDVHRALGLDFEELVVVEDAADDLVHVIRLVGRVRDQRVELEILGGQVVPDRARGAGIRLFGGSARLLLGR